MGRQRKYSEHAAGDLDRAISVSSFGSSGTTASAEESRAPSTDFEKLEGKPAKQMFAVCRHAERADSAWSESCVGPAWHETDEFLRHPCDPPLSAAGLAEASAMGHRMKKFAEENGQSFHFVVSSPYYRCVQTAVEIIKILGTGTELLLDASLGEVYNQDTMGVFEPSEPVRARDAALDLCSDAGITCRGPVRGKWPVWRETVRDSKWRVGTSFLKLLRSSTAERTNFIVVTHAEGVGAALGVMPTEAGSCVSKVESGGMFLAARRRPGLLLRQSPRGSSDRCSSSPPGPQKPGEDEAAASDDDSGAWAPPLAATSGWRLVLHRIRRCRYHDDPQVALKRRCGGMATRNGGLSVMEEAGLHRRPRTTSDLVVVSTSRHADAEAMRVVEARDIREPILLSFPGIDKIQARRKATM